MKSIGNSFTSLDAKDVKQSLIDYLVNEHGMRESDFTESSVMNVIIELLAGTSDMLNYRIDRQALETHLSTAKQRSNIKSILSNLGYRMKMGSTAVGEVKALIPLTSYVPGKGVNIKRGTQLQVADEVGERFSVSCSKDTLIPFPNPNQIKTTIPLVLGTFTSVDINVLDLMESSRVYIATSSDKFVDAANVTLTIANRVWKQVDNVLADYSDSGETYSVFEDKYDRPYILLHRNYKRTLQSFQNQPAKIDYLEVPIEFKPKGRLTIKPTTIVSIDSRVDLTGVEFSEMSEMVGHLTREEVDSAKNSAMKNIRTLDRAVTLQDFEALCLQVPGVKNCKAVDWKSRMITMPYEVAILVHVEGGLVLSEEFIKKVKAHIEPKMLSTLVLDVRTANIIKVDVEAEIVLDKFISNEGKLLEDLNTFIYDYFKDNSKTFGNQITSSDIIFALRSFNKQILDVNLIFPNTSYDEVPDIYSLYELGDVEIRVRRGE